MKPDLMQKHIWTPPACWNFEEARKASVSRRSVPERSEGREPRRERDNEVALSYGGTLQDHAENFWHLIAPELPANMLTRIAFAFGAHRQVTASQRNIDLARTANAACHWNGYTEGFLKTHFGRIVFAPPAE